MSAFRKADVYIRDCFAGVLEETDEGYAFSYDFAYIKSENVVPVSLTLPLQNESFTSKTLFSFFFDGLIPEGWLLNVVTSNWKIPKTIVLRSYWLRARIQSAMSVFRRSEYELFMLWKNFKNKNESGWHKSCIQKFFGTTQLPKIDLDDDTLALLAIKSTSQGLTVPGVQKKLSLHLLVDGNTPRLTIVDYPTGYILKPQVEQFVALPESEHLVMRMADAVGIATVPHALIKNGNTYAYITKRIDRVFKKTV